MRKDISRRRTLKLSVATASAGMFGGLAGCSNVPFIGGGADYTQWAFEPGTVSDSDHLSASFVDYATIVDNEDSFDSDYYESNFENTEDSFPINAADLGVEDLNWQVSVSGYGGAVVADYNQEDVVGELEDNDFDDETDHEGYTIYLGSDEGRAVGIDGSTLVHSSGGFGTDESPDAIVEALIDTSVGEEDRYVDENEHFAALSDEWGSPTVAFGSTQEPSEETNAQNGQFEGTTANGISIQVNGDTTDAKVAYVFEEEGDVDMDDVEEYADTDQFDDLDDIGTSQNGNVAVITGTIDTDDLQDVTLV